MMGPPGGGKSTLLQLLAGMLAGHAIKVCLLFLLTLSIVSITLMKCCLE